MKYTEKEFKEKAILMKPWILKIKEDFINTKQKLTVVCQNGHHNTILAASLVRDGRLDECPMCKVETKEDYNRNPKLCEYCGKPIKFDRTAQNTRNKKFCSHSCSAKISNKNRTKEKHCLNCGGKLEKSQTKYCNNICQGDYAHKDWIKKWLSNDTNKIIGTSQISSHIRKYLYEKYNNSCSVCGWSQVNPHTGKIPLEVEHIDGNYKNNREDNLTLLCPNCHSLTSTYKGANKGNGRPNRRKKRTE